MNNISIYSRYNFTSSIDLILVVKYISRYKIKDSAATMLAAHVTNSAFISLGEYSTVDNKARENYQSIIIKMPFQSPLYQHQTLI